MTLESAQILSTAHFINRSKFTDRLYRPTHINHPSTVWASLSTTNYEWLYQLFTELNNEYGYRYSKWHKSYLDLNELLKNPPVRCPEAPFVEPPQCMPDEYKISGDSVTAYRNYYRCAKQRLLHYTRRSPPDWINLIPTK